MKPQGHREGNRKTREIRLSEVHDEMDVGDPGARFTLLSDGVHARVGLSKMPRSGSGFLDRETGLTGKTGEDFGIDFMEGWSPRDFSNGFHLSVLCVLCGQSKWTQRQPSISVTPSMSGRVHPPIFRKQARQGSRKAKRNPRMDKAMS